MAAPEILETFRAQFNTLRTVVSQSKDRQIASDGTDIFDVYQNVYIKAYLVSACSILEAFVQDLAFMYIELMKSRFETANVPHNLVIFCAPGASDKPRDMKFEKFSLNKTREEVAEMLSASYYRTKMTFQKIGVDLSCPEVDEFKDFISATVDKRNKIIHHNDTASDLSYNDIMISITKFEAYMQILYNRVLEDQHYMG